ncbi:MAG: transposase-like zinc-binding domain-containing protein [Bacteroidales bacterium]
MKSCYTYGSFSIIKWGYQNGKQRYGCKECGQLYIIDVMRKKDMIKSL